MIYFLLTSSLGADYRSPIWPSPYASRQTPMGVQSPSLREEALIEAVRSTVFSKIEVFQKVLRGPDYDMSGARFSGIPYEEYVENYLLLPSVINVPKKVHYLLQDMIRVLLCLGHKYVDGLENLNGDLTLDPQGNLYTQDIYSRPDRRPKALDESKKRDIYHGLTQDLIQIALRTITSGTPQAFHEEFSHKSTYNYNERINALDFHIYVAKHFNTRLISQQYARNTQAFLQDMLQALIGFGHGCLMGKRVPSTLVPAPSTLVPPPSQTYSASRAGAQQFPLGPLPADRAQMVIGRPLPSAGSAYLRNPVAPGGGFLANPSGVRTDVVTMERSFHKQETRRTPVGYSHQIASSSESITFSRTVPGGLPDPGRSQTQFQGPLARELLDTAGQMQVPVPLLRGLVSGESGAAPAAILSQAQASPPRELAQQTRPSGILREPDPQTRPSALPYPVMGDSPPAKPAVIYAASRAASGKPEAATYAATRPPGSVTTEANTYAASGVSGQSASGTITAEFDVLASQRPPEVPPLVLPGAQTGTYTAAKPRRFMSANLTPLADLRDNLREQVHHVGEHARERVGEGVKHISERFLPAPHSGNPNTGSGTLVPPASVAASAVGSDGVSMPLPNFLMVTAKPTLPTTEVATEGVALAVDPTTAPMPERVPERVPEPERLTFEALAQGDELPIAADVDQGSGAPADQAAPAAQPEAQLASQPGSQEMETTGDEATSSRASEDDQEDEEALVVTEVADVATAPTVDNEANLWRAGKQEPEALPAREAMEEVANPLSAGTAGVAAETTAVPTTGSTVEAAVAGPEVVAEETAPAAETTGAGEELLEEETAPAAGPTVQSVVAGEEELVEEAAPTVAPAAETTGEAVPTAGLQEAATPQESLYPENAVQGMAANPASEGALQAEKAPAATAPAPAPLPVAANQTPIPAAAPVGTPPSPGLFQRFMSGVSSVVPGLGSTPPKSEAPTRIASKPIADDSAVDAPTVSSASGTQSSGASAAPSAEDSGLQAQEPTQEASIIEEPVEALAPPPAALPVPQQIVPPIDLTSQTAPDAGTEAPQREKRHKRKKAKDKDRRQAPSPDLIGSADGRRQSGDLLDALGNALGRGPGSAPGSPESVGSPQKQSAPERRPVTTLPGVGGAKPTPKKKQHSPKPGATSPFKNPGQNF